MLGAQFDILITWCGVPHKFSWGKTWVNTSSFSGIKPKRRSEAYHSSIISSFVRKRFWKTVSKTFIVRSWQHLPDVKQQRGISKICRKITTQIKFNFPVDFRKFTHQVIWPNKVSDKLSLLLLLVLTDRDQWPQTNDVFLQHRTFFYWPFNLNFICSLLKSIEWTLHSRIYN